MYSRRQILIYFLLAVAFLLHASVSIGHVFDKDTVELYGVGDTDTFTMTDPTGCAAYTYVYVDPSIAWVTPINTGPVVTQTYTVEATGIGTTTITVNWYGIDYERGSGECTEVGSHVINVIVHELIEEITPTPTPSPISEATPTPSPSPISEETPTIPLTISSIDIHPIQVVQDPPGDAEEETTVLVARKETMVRVFIAMDASDGTVIRNVRGVCRFAGQEDEIIANLHQVNGETLVIPINDEETFISSTPRLLLKRIDDNGWKAFNFFKISRAVRPEVGEHDIEFTIYQTSESTVSSGNGVETFTFREYQDGDGFENHFDIRYMFLEIEPSYVTSGMGFTRDAPSGYEGDMSQYFEHLICVYPIPRRMASYDVDPGVYGMTSFAFRPDLSFYRLIAGLAFGYYDRFVFMVPGKDEDRGRERGFLQEFYGNTLGVTRPGIPWTSFVQTNTNRFVVAHELGHTYGLDHTAEPAGDGWDVREVTGAGPKPSEKDYEALVAEEYDNRPESKNWITFQEYNTLLDQFVQGGATGSSRSKEDNSKKPSLKKKSRDLLVVSGAILFNGELSLYPFFQSSSIADTDNSIGDDYSIVILSKSGKELSRVDFDADFMELGEGGEIGSPFVFKMPFSKKAKKIEFRKNGRILESRKVSKRPPSVSITKITKVDSATYKVKIRASDKDKDTLNYLILYTPDGKRFFGVDYEWVEEGKTFQFDISHLPGSDEGKIQVLVTDGVRSTTAFSSTFKVPNQSPMISIMNPIEGAKFEKGSGNIVFSGSAMDQEDGNLLEDYLTWQSDKDGTLGTGDIIEVQADDLSTGTHTITFIAKDSSGSESSTTTTIEVVETAKPDAVIQDIGFSPSIPAVSDDVTISALVTNFGKDATGTVTFFDGDPDTGGTQISSSEIVLSANSTTKASASWTPSTSGDKSIFVRVSGLDPTEEVTDNNTMSETIEIFSGASLSVSTDQLEFGDEETLLNFYIENLEGGTLDWSITESGDDQDAISVSVTSGETPGEKKEFIVVKLNRPGKDNDTHNVTLKVSSNGGDSEIKVSYQDK